MKHVGDPRLQVKMGAGAARATGIKLAVRLPRKDIPAPVLGLGVLLVAILLFVILKSAGTSNIEPRVPTVDGDSATSAWQTPPPLYIPDLQPVQAALAQSPADVEPDFRSLPTGPASLARPAWTGGEYSPQPGQMLTTMPPPFPRTSAGSTLVVDTGTAMTNLSSTPNETLPAQSAGRVRASSFANPSTTVPQGSMIPAVIETGFDSSNAGFARAIVSRDVRGFDGKNVIIPRGSRLIGEYRAQAVRGQNRAFIIWTRLIRPDGMTIALDSPAVDTLGRGGLPASVNSHFFGRLGDALLQSVVQLGTAVAARAVTGPMVYLPSGGSAGGGQPATANAFAPTLTLRPGSSANVFVAHDLDFSAGQVTQ